jgi:putative hydrolase of the HAD superfamily
MQAVILDVGGVLLVPHADEVSKALGVPLSAEQAERAHYAGAAALDASIDEPSNERNDYLSAYAQSLGMEPVADVIDKMRALWSGPTIDLWRQHVTGSVDGLKALHKRQLKLGIVSNADGTIEEQLRRGLICQVGEGLGVPVLAIIDSHVVGVAKPRAEIFRHALDPLGVAPEQAVYVGDTRRYDIAGARAAGLQPVHFDPYQLCAEPTDHVHVRRLGEVERLLA